eukprot:CAMPEP_0174266906 /NCGR_PEP_ID=MMETSP0439-20130205/31892_1 /TAXON_ID=0 /ORGANISM="Stereomyxa ramosa, Strain Chinc5" /LENGTH=724 /DNA_ID=CAMNT_0015354155 /DNA_START=512 /DNA_END=2686 /DNA_ORIENTATION=+
MTSCTNNNHEVGGRAYKLLKKKISEELKNNNDKNFISSITPTLFKNSQADDKKKELKKHCLQDDLLSTTPHHSKDSNWWYRRSVVAQVPSRETTSQSAQRLTRSYSGSDIPKRVVSASLNEMGSPGFYSPKTKQKSQGASMDGKIIEGNAVFSKDDRGFYKMDFDSPSEELSLRLMQLDLLRMQLQEKTIEVELLSNKCEQFQNYVQCMSAKDTNQYPIIMLQDSDSPKAPKRKAQDSTDIPAITKSRTKSVRELLQERRNLKKDTPKEETESNRQLFVDNDKMLYSSGSGSLEPILDENTEKLIQKYFSFTTIVKEEDETLLDAGIGDSDDGPNEHLKKEESEDSEEEGKKEGKEHHTHNIQMLMDLPISISDIDRQRQYHQRIKQLNEGWVTEKSSIKNFDSNFNYLENVNWFEKYFYGKKFTTYIGIESPLGIFIAVTTSKNDSSRVLIFHQDGEQKYLGKFNKEEVSFVNIAQRVNPILLQTGIVKEVSNSSLSETIIEYEGKENPSTYKFGILLAKQHQSNELDLFGNNEGSEYWDEFLNFIGKEINLSGFTGFRGGLDVCGNTTGEKSVFSNWRGNEIMWHVSTMLPYDDENKQQLHRKRHIGNDVCIIIFLDGDDITITGNLIKSQFIHNIITVKPLKELIGKTKYEISVLSREDVPSFGPPIPENPVFSKTPLFKDFLFSKLINAEYASKRSIYFSKRLRVGRMYALNKIVDTYFF